MCSCALEFFGSPPNCRPECTVNSECDASKSCLNQKCVNPCANVCGIDAECRVVNHAPICSCRQGFEGDPFVRCLPEQSKYISTCTYLSNYYLFPVVVTITTAFNLL